MQNKITQIIVLFGLLFITHGCVSDVRDDNPQPESSIWNPPVGQDAPEDAFFHGEEVYAYYGSDNPWNLRYFYGYFDDWEKRRGQRMMLDMMDNKFEDAEFYARDVLKRDPENLEAYFNLSVALAHQNKLEEAMQIVEQAIDRGLPFRRYLAGPRNILKPLTDTDLFQTYASKFNFPLLHGPMVGQVTENSASFWFRTAEESEVHVRIGNNKSISNVISASGGQSKAADDYTVIVTVDNLLPDTRYYYEVLVNGEKVNDLKELSFKTFPSLGSKTDFVVAFGGCAGYVPDNERIWNVISDKEPLAFLAMGDNKYINMINHANHPLAMQHYSYYRRQSRPEFRSLTSSSSFYAIWDDHEFTDDVWLGPYVNKPFWKLPLLKNFQENWINPSYGTEEYPGVWHKFSIGDVDFFMLDGRFYRTNPYANEPSKVNDFAEYPTMLGPVQKQWLFDELKKSEAEFKVIASPVPWSYEANPGTVDTWYGYSEEREEVFSFLTKNSIEGVVLLSADRHRSDAWKIERLSDYPLYEFTSGRLTNDHRHSLMPGALFGYNDKQSVGILHFQMSGSDPELTYKIISIDDEEVESLSINKSDLKLIE
ncbi:MAG: alkaline phosphatase D family protein [Balneolales bacterium]